MSGRTTERLGRLARVRVSNVDKLTRDGERDVRLCNYVDVYKNDAITPDLDFMRSTASDSQVTNFRLRTGDTVFTKDSETADDIGIPAYVEADLDDLVCGYHLAIATPDPRAVDPRFLYWAMASTLVREHWTALASGVTRVGLRSDDITKVSVPLTPLDEQRRIADFLDTETARLDRAASALDRQRALASVRLEATAWTLTWGEADLRPVPLRRFIRRIKTGSTPPTAGPDYSSEVGVPWLAPTSIAENLEVGAPVRTLSRLAISSGTVPVFPADSVLVIGIGATAGKVAHLREVATGNQQLTAITTTPGLSARFLAWQLWSRSEELRSLAPYTTLPILGNDYLKSVPVRVPSTSTQRDVVARLDQFAETHASLRRLLDLTSSVLAERRQALITAAVTGQLDVTTSRGVSA